MGDMVVPVGPSGRGMTVDVERQEVDIQIATAKRYPRSLQRFRQRVLSMATTDAHIAEACFYKKPQGDQIIEGPGVRLAEIVGASYENLSVGARIIQDDGAFLTAQGVSVDLETNYRVSKNVQRRVTDRHGRRYSDDMVATTANAACAIAFRNAVLSCVPRALLEPIMAEIKKVAVGDERSLPTRRQAAFKYFADKGVAADRILARLGCPSLEDIGLEQLEFLTGLRTAILDGDLSLEEAFPADVQPEVVSEDQPANKAEAVASRLRRNAKGRSAQK